MTQRISRRGFLKGAGALAATAVAGPLILPSRLFGKTAPSNMTTVAMIGMGRQAYNSNLQPFLGMKNVRVISVCDVDSWRLEQGRKKIDEFYAQRDGGAAKGCMTTRDFREVLAMPDLDAVMISTPDHWHVTMGIMAARAGKDVCLEKPLTISIEEGLNLRNVMRETKRVFRTDSEFRSFQISQRAAEIVRNGAIGKLETIVAGVHHDPNPGIFVEPKEEPVPEELDYDMWLGPAHVAPYQVKRVHDRFQLDNRPNWMRITDYCDGTISNWGTHTFDIGQWGNNTDETGPIEMLATGEFPAKGNLWNTLMKYEFNARYANGVKLRSYTDYPFTRFEGDKGWVECDFSTGVLKASAEELRRYKPPAEGIHLLSRSEKVDFIECVRSRERTMADAEVGQRTNAIAHIALISIKLGRAVTWDPVSETFPNDPAANELAKRQYVRPPWSIS